MLTTKKKKKKRLETLEKSLDYLQWWHIQRAVLEVFYENQERESVGGEKASSDNWATCSELRNEVFKRARGKWCQFTEKSYLYFPYSEDGVSRLYFKIRKRRLHEIEKFDREVMARYPGERIKKIADGEFSFV